MLRTFRDGQGISGSGPGRLGQSPASSCSALNRESATIQQARDIPDPECHAQGEKSRSSYLDTLESNAVSA